MSNKLKLFIAIVVCEGAGIIGSFLTVTSVNTWYITLNKPFFTPPSWIFGPVWTLLYLLMGISLYLVWIAKKSKDRTRGLQFFFIQLVLNTLWSILFFGLKNPPIAFAEILIMWVFILLTIIRFRRINKTAAYLLYPYLAWVSFASLLNGSVALLNP